MDDTTTIEIRDDQHEWLEEKKRHEREPFKDVLDDLIDTYEDADEGDRDG